MTAFIAVDGGMEYKTFPGTKIDLTAVPTVTEIENLKNRIQNSPYRHWEIVRRLGIFTNP